MNHYEITFIVSGNLDEDKVAKVTKKVAGLIDELNGKILLTNPWGLRELAYPIKKERTGYYFTYILELEPDKLAGLINEINIMPEILRYLSISLEKERIPLEQAMKFDKAKTEREKKVAGPMTAPRRRMTYKAPEETIIKTENKEG